MASGSSPADWVPLRRLKSQTLALSAHLLYVKECTVPVPEYLNEPSSNEGLPSTGFRRDLHLWEEVLLLSWRPGSPLEATPDRELASLPFLLVWSSLA